MTNRISEKENENRRAQNLECQKGREKYNIVEEKNGKRKTEKNQGDSKVEGEHILYKIYVAWQIVCGGALFVRYQIVYEPF